MGLTTQRSRKPTRLRLPRREDGMSWPFHVWFGRASRLLLRPPDEPRHVRGTERSLIRRSHHRFLLKYATRDEVEVLARGSNGVVEMRSNIEQYTESSALFGFLRYRRRNVLLKYMPEDCSRLIQGWCSLPIFPRVCLLGRETYGLPHPGALSFPS